MIRLLFDGAQQLLLAGHHLRASSRSQFFQRVIQSWPQQTKIRNKSEKLAIEHTVRNGTEKKACILWILFSAVLFFFFAFINYWCGLRCAILRLSEHILHLRFFFLSNELECSTFNCRENMHLLIFHQIPRAVMCMGMQMHFAQLIWNRNRINRIII